ncbi:TetR/AcrR family transcriptional regulator [Sphingomonas sp. SRS2]|uniref:TetR/AcrR family transcriptional regulator n=1 Tax=Sphingomonas sp. SRS2 TaxID=133190 RepID=UPI0006183E92|nr:TetR/AcrR family transcriptional regulator [Sphingomonas sp. SRS2]KKC26367.1 TetR family transcriptional regulator [Sphingomonas sp. SRS2]
MIATKKSAGRGRPRSFDPEAALATAQTLFQQHGYDGVGVAEIGKAMGITPPSFYNAFGSKAALFDAVLDRYTADFGNLVLAALDGEGDMAAAVERVLKGAARLYPGCDGIAGCLVIDGARGSQDPEARALTARRMAESHDVIAARIARELPDRADALAASVVIALKGMSSAARDGATMDELTAFADMAVAGFRAAVARK